MMFDNQSLDQAVARVLGDIPADHNIAIVGVVDSLGARAAFQVKKNVLGDWLVLGEVFAGHEWASNDLEFGARIAASGTL